jgi:C-terminal processing protease CtpA/Prc
VSVEVAVVRGADRFRTRMTKRIVTIPTVPLVRTYSVSGRRVGYVVFRNFVEPSYDALDAAFAELRAAGVTELVLDLRYNGGGLVGVARHLASLIGGMRTGGAVLAEYFHNDRYQRLNEIIRFEAKANALALDRLMVITTRASASASELVINALRPFMAVHVIGDRTYGKPVGQYAISFCDKTLAPVSFTLRNANGEGDYFDGIAVTCAAADDLSRQLGDPLEGSLREALAFIDTGRCSAESAGMRTRQAAPGAEARPAGWESLLNAR